MNVGDRRGALTIISVDRSRGVVELVCPDGHSDTRPYESVRVSASPRCRWCVPPATPLQLETLRIIRRHEQETAEGMTRVQILEAIRRNSPYVLHSLRTKGWVEEEDGAWYLTDDGIDVLEGRRAARVVPPKSTTPAVAQATIDSIADDHGLTRNDILGRSRSPRVVRARHEAMARVRALGFSYPELGRIFNRDHTTIMQACRKLATRAEAAE